MVNIPWEVTYQEDHHIVVAKVVGRTTILDIPQNAEQTVQLLHQHGCNRLLLDGRDAEISLTTIEIYYLPETYERIHLRPSCRIAILLQNSLPSHIRADMQFLEDVFVNGGFKIRVFYDATVALSWLNSQH
jgi:hypothetical protein